MIISELYHLLSLISSTKDTDYITIVIIPDSVPLPFIAIEKLLLFYEHSKEIEFIGLKYSCNKSYINILHQLRGLSYIFGYGTKVTEKSGTRGYRSSYGYLFLFLTRFY